MDSQETNDFDLLRGKKIVEMEKHFQQRLDEIEKRHMDYFKKRPPSSQQDEHDRLYNHYFYHQYDQYARLFWLEESGINRSIKEEVEKAFKEIFV